MNNYIEFPTFLYGSFLSLHRRILNESKKWVSSYEKTKTFPEIQTQIIQSDSVIYTCDKTDLYKNEKQWRLYFIDRLCDLILEKLNWKDFQEVACDFEDYMLGNAWGALAFSISGIPPNSIKRVTLRIEALTRFWEILESLNYVGPQSILTLPMSDLMSTCYSGFLKMWLDEPTDDILTNLHKAIYAINNANENEQHNRLVNILCNLALEEESLREDLRLSDPSWISSKINQIPSEALENIMTGNESHLLGVLYDLKEE